MGAALLTIVGMTGWAGSPAGAGAVERDGSEAGCHWAERTPEGTTYRYGRFASIRPGAPAADKVEYPITGPRALPPLDEATGPGMGPDADGDAVTYRVHGPAVAPDTAPLRLPGSPLRRPSAWTADPRITWTVSPGLYRLAIYSYDWDKTDRQQQIAVSLGTGPATTVTMQPGPGVWSRFVVEVPGVEAQQLHIDVTATASSAVVAGIFLDVASSGTGITFDSYDTTTKGDWEGTYGSLGAVLAGVAADAPPGSAMPWQATHDVAQLGGTGAYNVAGTTFVWGDAYDDDPVEAPAYTYAFGPWTGPESTSCSYWIPREETGGPPVPGDERPVTWDVDTRGMPLLVDLHLPKARAANATTFRLCLNAADHDQSNRRQTIKLLAGDGTELDAILLGGPSPFSSGGVTLCWTVPFDTDLTIAVVPDSTTIATLSGIFVDELVTSDSTTSTTGASSTTTTGGVGGTSTTQAPTTTTTTQAPTTTTTAAGPTTTTAPTVLDQSVARGGRPGGPGSSVAGRSASRLGVTGIEVGPLIALGLGLFALGAILVARARRPVQFGIWARRRAQIPK